MKKADEYKFRKSHEEMRYLMESSNRRMKRLLWSMTVVTAGGLLLIFA